MSKTPPVGEVFPIRTVVALTGVHPVTLRAWERRYGLISPARTPSGHRLYTQEHIASINRVRALLEKGVAIGQVSRSLKSSVPAANRPWSRLRERMIGAITQFDERLLDETYNEALGAFPLETVTDQLLVPLLEEMGKRWESREGSVAEEHFFSMYVRNKLGARFHHRTHLMQGPKLLGVCAPGEHHEIGLLLFALSAHEAGMRSVLLGANTPLEELPVACRRAECDAVVISSSIESPQGLWSKQLPELTAQISQPVYVGGVTSVRQRDAIAAAGAIPLGADIVQGVHRIHKHLSKQRVNA